MGHTRQRRRSRTRTLCSRHSGRRDIVHRRHGAHRSTNHRCPVTVDRGIARVASLANVREVCAGDARRIGEVQHEGAIAHESAQPFSQRHVWIVVADSCPC